MSIKHMHKPDKQKHIDEAEIHLQLTLMVRDGALKTIPSITKDQPTSLHLLTFYEKHMLYLKEHPKVNPEHYLSNLRTMIKIRP